MAPRPRWRTPRGASARKLLRAWETSPLAKANFCVLMRIGEAELDAALEQARQERQERRTGG
jgi:hypothetical protein